MITIKAIVCFYLMRLSHEFKIESKYKLNLDKRYSISEDATLLVPQLLEKYGYPCEIHNVTTRDGYKLVIHRVPYGKEGPGDKIRPAVYLIHGLLSSSADWVLNRNKGLLYSLLEAGYDVWMPNVRGNRYSRNHETLDPDNDDEEFWNFSWHDIAIKDLPPTIDYVISSVKQEKIYYIGHSQGTTAFYVLCSELPEYNDKIKVMISLAPVAWVQSMTSPLLKIIAATDWVIGPFLQIIGVHEFLPRSSFFATIGDILCDDDALFQPLCVNALFAIFGFNKDQMNASLIPTIMGHTPAGAATKQILHYTQLHNSGKFRQWDYGFIRNLIKYRSFSPPEYNLKKVTAPVYLYYSGNDWLSNIKDVDRLSNSLGNVVGRFKVPDDKFNHIDYIYAIDAFDLVYSNVISVMSAL